MKIDFSKIEEVSMPAFKGGEKSTEARMFFDGKCRIMRLHLESGASIGVHSHDTSLEVFYILSGKGRAVCDGVTEELNPGDAHYCLNGSTHTLINDGNEPLELFAIVPEVK